ncbi:MAG: 4Fe-4S binding protein [Anaerolineales bacterium]
MPSRGQTIKTASDERLVLTRPMVTRRYELTVRHDVCCGCDLCAKVCPKEAITLSTPVVADGRLIVPARVDIAEDKCIFCGECVALCPTHALGMTVNGEPEVPVIQGKAFPLLIRRMVVNQDPLEANLDVSYIERCPSGALSAEIERDEQGVVRCVRNVRIDRALCFNCTRCMVEGPTGAFEITKPYLGRVSLDASLCPTGCQACADACPTHALTYEGNAVVLDERFCLYCGACERVCPVSGAVHSVRTGFLHAPIQSGAWTRALDKLVSYHEAVREYALKGQRKRRDLVIQTLLGGEEENA